MDDLGEEYRLERVDLGGSRTVYVKLNTWPPLVLADHSTPTWLVDAHVRACLIKDFIAASEAERNGDGGDRDNPDRDGGDASGHQNGETGH